ncbi:MAG: nucleotide exchange factor GrpE [Candidatus Eisenbacteria bacterium]|uniref:Protein GrpE n=1 Tax=Eiseniibacteriota bacterium TaxID=2212470 RepID=A0A538TA04_UNCEI|nr:MAG: nucleotide exchange factor GrpE [Candidatus Eisenbacteria bacterium]
MNRKKDQTPEHPDVEIAPEGRAKAPETGTPAAAEGPRPALVEDPARLFAELERARAREDELMRALAELTNMNRRRKQDMETAVLAARESWLRGILPVLDDIDRSLEASKDREGDPFRSGVLLIRDRLWQTLEKEGVEEIRALGERFDPELHDAKAQRPSGSHPLGTVLEVLVPGYLFKGRVLRHAQVVVAGSPAPNRSAQGMEGNAAPGAGEVEF